MVRRATVVGALLTGGVPRELTDSDDDVNNNNAGEGLDGGST